MKPFVELSFMPTALASGNKTVFNYKANVTPPRDYKQWATLIDKLVSHWVERYGAPEVREWFFEIWNEPNLKSFWTGTQRDYFKLYRSTVEAIKQVDASLRVGGPATAKSEWIEDFVDFCERNEVPADFVSTHQYPTDGFESDEETEVQLFKSQRGIMRELAQDTRRHARGRPVYYTEWNSSSNPRDPLHELCCCYHNGSQKSGRRLQLLDLLRHLRRELLSLRAFSRGIWSAKSPRHSQTDLSCL
jgi:xylan 1,4-beta-xylosidase